MLPHTLVTAADARATLPRLHDLDAFFPKVPFADLSAFLDPALHFHGLALGEGLLGRNGSTRATWPAPPRDDGALELLFGGATSSASARAAAARTFLTENYQTAVAHVHRPRAPAHLEEHVMNRAEVRATLDVLAARGLLVGSALAHRETATLARKERIPKGTDAATLLDVMHAMQNKSLVVTLDAALGGAPTPTALIVPATMTTGIVNTVSSASTPQVTPRRQWPQ